MSVLCGQALIYELKISGLCAHPKFTPSPDLSDDFQGRLLSPAFSAACLPAFLWESLLSFGMALQLSVSL